MLAVHEGLALMSSSQNKTCLLLSDFSVKLSILFKYILVINILVIKRKRSDVEIVAIVVVKNQCLNWCFKIICTVQQSYFKETGDPIQKVLTS